MIHSNTWSTIFMVLKYIAFTSFTAVSAVISVNMFISFSEDSNERLLLLITALAIELFKVFLIIQGNTFNLVGLKKKAFFSFSLYTLSVSLSLIASYGFNNNIIARNIIQSTFSPAAIELNTNKNIISTLESRLDDLNRRIASQEERIKIIPGNFTSQLREVNRIITQYDSQKSQILAQINELTTKNITLEQEVIREKVEQKSTAGIFAIMVESFKGTILEWLKENPLKMTLLTIVSIIIELGIIITAPSLRINKDRISHVLGETLPVRETEEVKNIAQDVEIHQKEEKRKIRRKKSLSENLQTDSEAKSINDNNQENDLSQKEEEVQIEAERVDKNTEEQVKEIKIRRTGSRKESPIASETVEVDSTDSRKIKKRYRIGVLTEEQKNHFINFVKALFGTEGPAKLSPLEVAVINSQIPQSYAEPFFKRLLEIKGRTGFPMISPGKNNAEYKANYSKDYILQYLLEEI